MKLVMTLLARDEADIVDAQIAFHLNAGVDFVVATDNRSVDGTTEILESYAREGYLHLIRESSDDLQQGEWVTRMARLAATEFGADWVINSDADEFWWPRGATLEEILSAVPKRFGTVRGLLRNFVPRPSDDDAFFGDRMIVRETPQALSTSSPLRVQEKVVHRADPSVRVSMGNHDAFGDTLTDLRGWYPLEILHFPLRSAQQCERKLAAHLARATRHPNVDPWARVHPGYEALRAGRVPEYFASLAVDDGALERGLAEGSFVLDTRLRDTLHGLRRVEARPDAAAGQFRLPSHGARALELPCPTLADDAVYAAEITVGSVADSVLRAERRIDELGHRLATVDRGGWARLRDNVAGFRNRWRSRRPHR